MLRTNMITEQDIRVKSAELDHVIAQENKVIADAQARIAGAMVSKNALYLDFAKAQVGPKKAE